MKMASSIRIVVVCLALLPASLCYLLNDANASVEDLLRLITDEKKHRATLEREMAALRNDIAGMKARHTNTLCSCPAGGVQAFSATLTQDITNFGTHQPLVFDHVITNVGGGYDSRHGMFRAASSGIFKFSFSVLQGTTTMWIGLELVKDGTVIGRIKTGDNGYWNMGTNVVTVHLNKDDDVWVRHMSDSDTKRVVASGGFFTMFTGHSVQAD